MTIQTPTRITIEIQPASSESDSALDGGATGTPVVRVLRDGGAASFPITVGAHREDGPQPTAYEPGPCTCLDDEDCGADHGND